MDKVFNLADFDKYREDNRLEVKKAKGGLPNSLWETYSSMCNTYGGAIILGVVESNDKSWRTTGLKDVSKLKKDFWDNIHNKQKVSVNLLQEKDVVGYEHDGDAILVIYVPRALREVRPVYINDDLFGGTFRRDWEGDYHCTPSEVKAMLRDQAKNSPDMKVLEGMRTSDFDADTIKVYRRNYDLRHPEHAWTTYGNDKFLEAVGAAVEIDGTFFPTAAGLLMFGQEYKITREFPEYFLDYREKLDPRVRWTDRMQSQSGDWSGNVYEFFTRVLPKLTQELKRPFQTDGVVRIEETQVHESVREVFANCLVNTDFFQSWSVVIEKLPDRLVFANPGSILTGKKQMLKGGISEPRNKNMMKMFNLLGIGDHAGSGVPDVYSVWKREKFDEPMVEEQFGRETPERTTVTLPLTHMGKAVGNGAFAVRDDSEGSVRALTKEEMEKLLAFCEAPRSRKEMQEYLGRDSRTHFNEDILKPLMEMEKIRMTIPDKPKSPKQKYVTA